MTNAMSLLFAAKQPDLLFASHLCYLLAGIKPGHPGPKTKIVLVGCDHRYDRCTACQCLYIHVLSMSKAFVHLLTLIKAFCKMITRGVWEGTSGTSTGLRILLV